MNNEQNIEQAKKWFKNIMLNCYTKKLDKYPDRIFWIYDKTIERKRKIAKINGNNDIKINLSDGDVVFEQDERNNNFWIKNNGYWSFLKSNFNLDYYEIKKLTTEVVNDILNCKQYTTIKLEYRAKVLVNDILNCKQYTTGYQPDHSEHVVNNILNCKQYTTKSMWITTVVNE